MTTNQIFIMATIVVYLAMMVIIGAIYSKRSSNVGDFYLGGRKLGPFVTAMSAEASDMSSWLLMGLPGVAYLTGIADAGWTAIGLGVGTYLNWLFVAKRLRHYSSKIDAITIPDFFSNRYKDTKKVLMAISALMIIIFFVPYTASGFSACGKLFGTLFGMDYHLAMIISAIVIVGYTSLGGFSAASVTDLIQSIVMTIALVIVLLFGVSQAGGMQAVIDNAKGFDGYLSMFNSFDLTTNSAKPYGAITILSTVAWGLGYFGMPHILLRFMAIGDPNKIKLSRRVATVWVIIAMAIGVFIGVIGLGMTNAGVLPQFTKSAEAETVIINTAMLLSNKGSVFVIAAGVILAGILASTMSTSDSQLLAASSAMSENILGGIFKIQLSEKAKMVIARVAVMIISVIAVILAWNEDSSVFKIVSFAWAGFGAAFGPVMLLALFWKRSNKYGAIFGMISGAATVFIWSYLETKVGGIFTIYELLPAFIIGLAVNVIVSLVTPKPDDDIIETFDAVKVTK